MKNIFGKKINKILAVVAVLVIVALFVVLAPKLFQKSKPAPQSSETQGAQSKTQSLNYEPGEVTILQGIIQDVASNSLVVKVQENEKNPVLQNRIFEVLISTSTEFFLLDKQFYFTKDKDETTLLPLRKTGVNNSKQESDWQKIELNSLQKEDAVIVVGNIEENDSFIAKRIYKIKV